MLSNHLQCVMLLSASCRHKTVRATGRIVLGEVRDLITLAEKHSLKNTGGPQSAEIHWQMYTALEDVVPSACCFWPLLLTSADYGHGIILSVFFPAIPGTFETIHFLNICMSHL